MERHDARRRTRVFGSTGYSLFLKENSAFQKPMAQQDAASQDLAVKPCYIFREHKRSSVSQQTCRRWLGRESPSSRQRSDRRPSRQQRLRDSRARNRRRLERVPDATRRRFADCTVIVADELAAGGSWDLSGASRAVDMLTTALRRTHRVGGDRANSALSVRHGRFRNAGCRVGRRDFTSSRPQNRA